MPPRDAHFIGRDALLEEMRESLADHTSSTLVSQPLHGLGGTMPHVTEMLRPAGEVADRPTAAAGPSGTCR